MAEPTDASHLVPSDTELHVLLEYCAFNSIQRNNKTAVSISEMLFMFSISIIVIER